NLCMLLAEEYALQVICINHDFNEKRLYPFIDKRVTHVQEPYGSVIYISETSSVTEITEIMKSFAPTYVYISGLGSIKFFLSGWKSALTHKAKLVIAPGEISRMDYRKKNM